MSNEEKINTCAKRKVYYNVSIPHNDLLSVGGSPTPARFEETRDEPLFRGRPCDWYMSVIRFTIPTTYIPIQIFPVEEDPVTPSNPNKSIYSITLSYNGSDFQEYLEWETQVTAVPIPPPPTGSTEREFQFDPKYWTYYGLFSYQHFCHLINKAIEKCFNTNIVPLLPAPSGTTVYRPPQINYDPATTLFSMTAQSTFLSNNPLPVELWFNTYLNNNFENAFNQSFDGFSLTANGKNVLFKFNNNRSSQKIPDVESPDGFNYGNIQDFTTINSSSSFTSIIIRSTSLPIRNEALTLQSKGNNNGTGIGSGQESIIADFEIDISVGNQLKPSIHYLPTAEYRRINMQGETPITRIDVEIFWKDNYDNLYPVEIPAHNIATIKILFEEV